MRSLIAVLALALAACGHKGTVAARVDGEDFNRYHRIGILPFDDPKGQGALIAEEIKKELAKRMYESVDTDALGKVLARYHLDRGEGLGTEALMDIKTHVAVDSFVLGKMAPDWSQARLILVETEMGAPIIQAMLKPPKKGKFFRDADEVVQEAVKVLTDPKYGS